MKVPRVPVGCVDVMMQSDAVTAKISREDRLPRPPRVEQRQTRHHVITLVEVYDVCLRQVFDEKGVKRVELEPAEMNPILQNAYVEVANSPALGASTEANE